VSGPVIPFIRAGGVVDEDLAGPQPVPVLALGQGAVSSVIHLLVCQVADHHGAPP
jgi:hypothetical protein